MSLTVTLYFFQSLSIVFMFNVLTAITLVVAFTLLRSELPAGMITAIFQTFDGTAIFPSAIVVALPSSYSAESIATHDHINFIAFNHF
jgi:hypothetical protein